MPTKPKGFGKFDRLMRKLVTVPPISDGVRVRIIGEHPHTGKTGVIKGGLQRSKHFPDWAMFEVRFEDGEGCFADEANLQRED